MWFLILCASILIVFTLIPLSDARQWWVRALDFPRLQITVLLLAWLCAAVTSIFLGAKPPVPLVVIVAACFLYQCYWIWPNTTLHKIELQEADPKLIGVNPSIKLLSSNVLMSNRDASKLQQLIGTLKPDILITLESDQWWQDQLDTLADYPHRLACPLDNLYGMHLYSRFPLLNPTIDFLVEPRIPSMGTFVELPDGEQIRLHVLHPTPPAPGENTRSTERDVELMILAEALEGKKDKIVVIGDLNDVAWSASTRLFRRITGLLDPRTGRGMYNTFHADHWFARWPLDHVFVSSHFRLIKLERLPHIGSDHFPVFIELQVAEVEELNSHPKRQYADEEKRKELLETEVAKSSDSPSL